MEARIRFRPETEAAHWGKYVIRAYGSVSAWAATIRAHAVLERSSKNVVAGISSTNPEFLQ